MSMFPKSDPRLTARRRPTGLSRLLTAAFVAVGWRKPRPAIIVSPLHRPSQTERGRSLRLTSHGV